METPEFFTNTFVINRCETPVNIAEGRERAQKVDEQPLTFLGIVLRPCGIHLFSFYLQLFQVNFCAATERKLEEMNNRQAEVEKEQQMLKLNKTE